MLEVITDLILITEDFNLKERVEAETLNNSATMLAEGLKSAYKNVNLPDRRATITITVNLEEGLKITRDYQLL